MAGVPTTGAPHTSSGPGWNPFEWFQDATSAAGNWLGGIGGNIASGIEGGFVATLIDIVKWLIPFVEITIGGLIILYTIGYAFKDEILAAVGTAVKAIALAG